MMNDRLAAMPQRVRESRPTLQLFCPDGIPYQADVLRLVRRDWDYSKSTLEILLSGGYGSAKSVLLAHLAITHCLQNPGARCGIARRTLPSLKATLFKEILEHLDDQHGAGVAPMREGVDYIVNTSIGSIQFVETGSEIVSLSWADRKYQKVRSVKLSMLIIEEASENDASDRQAFDEAKARLRRLPHVRENVLICATNPDDPDHWLYKYFIEPNEGGKVHPNRRVFFSKTADNVYLHPTYESQLRASMDARQVQRYLESRWVRLVTDRVYYAYDPELNYRRQKYVVDLTRPIILSWDFNIAQGKPLSCAVMQQDGDGAYHIFGETVVEGMRTEGSCDELAGRGFLDYPVPHFIIAGDAAGKARDTRSNRSDYDLIVKFMANYRRQTDAAPIKHLLWVPRSNPPIRTRHNLVNGKACNSEGKRALFAYEAAPTAHEGMRLVDLRKGGDYVEDDSKAYQHVTTAVGYGIYANETFGAHEQSTIIREF